MLSTDVLSSLEGEDRVVQTRTADLSKPCMIGSNAPSRTLIKTDIHKRGLDSGDVVVLSEGSRGTYSALASCADPSSPASYILSLQPHDSIDYPGCSYLEVVRQAGFIGFRSSLASHRFIQPRKKAPHTLLFYNLHLGIWEQWEILNEEEALGAKWTECKVRLRNRRMPLVELVVDMIRVGRYNSQLPLGPESMGGASLEEGERQHRRTTASVAPSEAFSMFGSGGFEEDEQLKRISGLFLSEWVKFAEGEKRQRALVESEVSRMTSELAELKVHSVGRIERLRAEMRSIWDVCNEAREGRKRAIEAAVAASWRRSNNDLVLGVLLSWRGLVTTRLRLGGLLLRAVIATARRRMGGAFSALRDHARARRVLNRIMIRAVTALVTKMLRKALLAWAAESREIHDKVVIHCQRSTKRRLGSLFGAWRLLADPGEDSVGIRGASSTPLSLFSMKQEWRTKLRVMREWLLLSASIRRLVLLSGRLERRLSFLTLGRSFSSWREEVVRASSEREELRRCIKRKQVAFQQFKQWYWSAFDSATQDTIRRLVMTTEDLSYTNVDDRSVENYSSPMLRARLRDGVDQQPESSPLSLGASPLYEATSFSLWKEEDES